MLNLEIELVFVSHLCYVYKFDLCPKKFKCVNEKNLKEIETESCKAVVNLSQVVTRKQRRIVVGHFGYLLTFSAISVKGTLSTFI